MRALAPETSTVLVRFKSRAAWPLPDELEIQAGTLDDYRALRAFHYRGRDPAVVTSVLRIAHRSAGVIGRHGARRGADVVAGVLVRSLPPLGCGLRQVATGGRYSGLRRCDAAALLNAEVRTIARVVIEPRYRGLGLAVKLVRHALANPERESLRLTEALAAMGRVCPFFERAGMTRYDRPPPPQDARLLDALAHLGLEPSTLASRALMRSRIGRLEPAERSLLERELARWGRLHHAARRSGAGRPAQRGGEDARGDPASLEALLAPARDALLSQPVYYAYAHRPCIAERCDRESSRT